jgi:hypothetical protein
MTNRITRGFRRIGVGAAVVVALAASAQAANTCTDSEFCRSGHLRETCSQNGYLIWYDTRLPLPRSQFNRLVAFIGSVPSPPCSCVDLRKECLATNRTDCEAAYRECNSSGAR